MCRNLYGRHTILLFESRGWPAISSIPPLYFFWYTRLFGTKSDASRTREGHAGKLSSGYESLISDVLHRHDGSVQRLVGYALSWTVLEECRISVDRKNAYRFASGGGSVHVHHVHPWCCIGARRVAVVPSRDGTRASRTDDFDTVLDNNSRLFVIVRSYSLREKYLVTGYRYLKAYLSARRELRQGLGC